MKTKAVKEFIRHPYAWPGGYPRFAVCDDGAALCHKCTKANAKLIIRSTREEARDGWDVAGVDINYEDETLYCEHCNERIESAYGEKETAA